MMSWVKPSASPPRTPPPASSANGITASEALCGVAASEPASMIGLWFAAGAAAGCAGKIAQCRSARMASHAWRTGPKSSSSDWKSAAAAARWSSQAPNWPRRASLVRSAMWAQLSNGVSSSHFSRWAEHVFGLGRERLDQMFQYGRVAGPETAALRGQPIVEKRAAVDLQPLEEIADEQRRQRLQTLGIELFDSRGGRRRDIQRVDRACRRDQARSYHQRFRSCGGPVRRERPAACSGTSEARPGDRLGHPTAVRRACHVRPGGAPAPDRPAARAACAMPAEPPGRRRAQSPAAQTGARKGLRWLLSPGSIPRQFPRLLPRWASSHCFITEHDKVHPARKFVRRMRDLPHCGTSSTCSAARCRNLAAQTAGV